MEAKKANAAAGKQAVDAMRAALQQLHAGEGGERSDRLLSSILRLP